MSIPTEVFLFFGCGFFLFGTVFALLGLNSERGYWSQRDPSGNPREAATKFNSIYHRAFAIATGEYRAPLRIAAIGVVLWYFAGLSFAIALVLYL